jgi:chaperonin GroES
MTSKIQPSGDRVLVKKIEDDNKTKTGLVLPDDVKERPTKGEILEVGEGKTNDEGKLLPIKFEKGDLIIYPKYSGHPIKVDGEEFLILDSKEILAILKEEK